VTIKKNITSYEEQNMFFWLYPDSNLKCSVELDGRNLDLR